MCNCAIQGCSKKDMFPVFAVSRNAVPPGQRSQEMLNKSIKISRQKPENRHFFVDTASSVRGAKPTTRKKDYKLDFINHLNLLCTCKDHVPPLYIKNFISRCFCWSQSLEGLVGWMFSHISKSICNHRQIGTNYFINYKRS